jgi:hypothetical protein
MISSGVARKGFRKGSRSGEAKGDRETRNETKRNETGILAPRSRRDQSAYFSRRPTSLVHEKSRCDDYSSTQFDSERGTGGEVK